MPVTIIPLLGRYWSFDTPPRWLVLMAPIAMNIGFGFYPVIFKIFASGKSSTHHANPFVFTLYRGLCAFPILFLASYLVEGVFPIPNLRMTLNVHWGISEVFFGFSFFGIAGGQFLYIAGTYILPADLVSAFQPLIPVWTTVLSIVFCTEKIPSLYMLHSWAKMIGIIVAAGGAIKLALSGYEPNTTETGKQVIGYLCIIVATVFIAISFIIQKKFIFQVEDSTWKNYPLAITGYSYLFGCIYELLFCLYFVMSAQTEVFYLPNQSLPALVYAVFITSVFCYFLVTWSNKYLPSSVMTAFWPLQVVTTVITAYSLLGDTLTYTQLLSASTIIVGLGLVIYSNKMDEKINQTSEGGIQLDNRCKHHKINASYL